MVQLSVLDSLSIVTTTTYVPGGKSAPDVGTSAKLIVSLSVQPTAVQCLLEQDTPPAIAGRSKQPRSLVSVATWKA